jgi:hypothetical protein
MQTISEPRPLFRRRAALAAVVLFAFIGASAARAQSLSTAPVVTGAALGVSSITWTWDLTFDATGYRILSSTSPGLNISGDLPAYTNTFTLTGFSTNTPVSVMVEAFGVNTGVGFTVDAPTSTIVTLAAQPSGTMLLSTNYNVVTLSWVVDGNNLAGPGISYNVNWTTATGIGVLYSTNPSVNVFNDSATATINDLPSGITVNFDVQAVNSSGAVSGFDVIVSTYIPLLVNQPIISSASFADGVSSITWYWSASTGAIAYQLFSGTNGAVSPFLSSTTLSYTETGLSTNTNVTDYVLAFDIPASTTSAPFTVATLAAQTTGLTLLGLFAPPAPSFSTPTELLSWGANGNPVGTQYDVLWWTNLTTTVTVVVATGTTNALITGLYGGSTIYFTVQSVNLAGSTAPFDATLSSTTFDVDQSTYFLVSAQVIPVGYAGVVTFVVPNMGGSGSGVVTVQIASGTFSEAVTLNVSTPAANVVFPPLTGGVTDLPDPIHLTISANALTPPFAAQQPVLPVLLTVSYAAANFAANQSTLDISRYDTNHDVWIPLATTKLGNALIAVSDQLAPFAVLSVAAASGLSSITVGPNPLRPIVNPGALMTFRNLPAGCRVRIFSYVGENIVDMTADGSGTVAWNGRNHVGSYVASGVYIAVLEGAGTKKTMRVAIER